MPIANHFEASSARALRSGRCNSTSGALRGAAVLAQEAQLRDDGAYERQRDPKLQLRPTSPRTDRSPNSREKPPSARAAVIGPGANVARRVGGSDNGYA